MGSSMGGGRVQRRSSPLRRAAIARFLRKKGGLLRKRQDPEHCDTRRSADVDFAVDDGGDDELVRAELIAGGVRAAVVVLDDEVGGIVRVQDAGGSVFNGPENATLGAIGGDAWSCSRIRVRVCGTHIKRQREFRV